MTPATTKLQIVWQPSAK